MILNVSHADDVMLTYDSGLFDIGKAWKRKLRFGLGTGKWHPSGLNTHIHACIHPYVHTCILSYIHACIYTCMIMLLSFIRRPYIHASARTHTHTHTCTCKCKCTCTCYTHTYIHTYIIDGIWLVPTHVCMHVHVHVCIHAQKHAHAHATHTHTHNVWHLIGSHACMYAHTHTCTCTCYTHT